MRHRAGTPRFPTRLDSAPVRRPVSWAAIVPVALVELALLVATANRYGYHRDELYFIQAAKHPAFGYDDQPPLTPLLGRLSAAVFGDDPRGLRVVSALAAALVVVLVALLARELGAARVGQLAVATIAAASLLLAAGHILSTTTFDIVFWLAVAWLVTLLLGGADERLWLLVGVTVGVALENKHLVLLLLASLVELDNEEQGGPVWICRRPATPWSELWPELRHLSP